MKLTDIFRRKSGRIVGSGDRVGGDVQSDVCKATCQIPNPLNLASIRALTSQVPRERANESEESSRAPHALPFLNDHLSLEE
jgi:hypothetical protein